MAGARFYAKPSKDEVQIYLYLTYRRGKRLRYYTGHNIPPVHWDSEKQRVKPSRSFPQYTELNALLNSLANEAESIRLRYENSKSPLTDEVFKNELNHFRNKSDSEEPQRTFFRFFENFITKREGNHKYAKGSITVYKTTLLKVREFATVKRLKLDFDSFNEGFFVDFTNYLFSQRYGPEDKNYRPNYVHKITSTLNTVLRDAERLEVSPNLKCKTGWLQVSKQEVEKIYLTLEELNTLWKHDFSKTDGLERVRDLFLIGCCTGLRFSDYSQIRSEDIHIVKGVNVLKIVTQKTRKPVEIPLNPLVLEILKKYGGASPKPISNAKTNQHLKDIGKLAGLTDEVTFTSFEEGKKRVFKTFPKYQLITTHTARRSFATNAYKAGASIVAIMKITGHKTETEFLKYIRLDNEEHALKMAESPFFKTWNFEKSPPESDS